MLIISFDRAGPNLSEFFYFRILKHFSNFLEIFKNQIQADFPL